MHINFLDSCNRGKVTCENGNGETGACCNDQRCDLDTIRSLPWNQNLGFTPDCYQRCDEKRCYNTCKIANIFHFYPFKCIKIR